MGVERGGRVELTYLASVMFVGGGARWGVGVESRGKVELTYLASVMLVGGGARWGVGVEGEQVCGRDKSPATLQLSFMIASLISRPYNRQHIIT